MGEFQFTHSGEQRRRRTAHRGSARQGLFAAAGTGGTHIHDTRGPQDIAQMLRAANALPTNLGFMGRGKANRPEALHQQDAGIAEDILHDLGAISMISSDSQAMGRVGEVTIRGWQTAHKMKTLRGALPGDGAKNDYFRTKRYIAKLTINPARAQGIAHEVGSLEPGKWADIVFWRPTFFGVKPSLVMKGGFIAAAAMGYANASIPTPQPVHYRPMFGAFGGVLSRTSLTFVSQAALANGAAESYGLHKRLASVKACRTVKKTDMVHNDYLPVMQIDAQTYEVRADGQLLTCEPASVLPMAQRYFLF